MSKLLGKFFSKLYKDELGQTTTEYILILAVVVMIALKFKSVFGNKLVGIVGNLGSQIEAETNDLSK